MVLRVAGLVMLAALAACGIHYVEVSVTAPPPSAPQQPRPADADAGPRD